MQLREVMRGQIKEVLSNLAKATVIVTHDQLEALTMADRIAVMRDGMIEQVATPHEIFARPSSLFVAGFIGTPQMNLLPATYIESDADGARFKTGGQEIRLAMDPAVSRLPQGSEIALGIRPRSLDVRDTAAPDTIAGRVDLIEPMGAETLLHLVEDGRDVRVVVDEARHFDIGDTVHLQLRAEQTHVFDATHTRIGAP